MTDTATNPHASNGKSFITIMEAIGRDCLKALSVIQAYLPAASTLASLIFPPAAAELSGASNIIALIQNAVATVEAKWAAGGESAKTGPQKLADVLALTESAVLDLLRQLGVQADSNYVTQLVNVVVAILNLSPIAVDASA